ncbi:hypothetical protein M569_06795, partial [Genlisea aurea]
GDVGGGGGNRWPKQETLALLRIRSEMDVDFRDSSFKGPLWEEVSRKMAELGFKRTGKKCKEKFENVYKYHRRTKESRSSKSDGKTYRFFDQLQALEENAPPHDTVSSMSPKPITVVPPVPANDPINAPSPPIHSFPTDPPQIQFPSGLLSTTSSSSSTSSDGDVHRRRGRKRRWKEFFHGLLRDVIHKQEELHRNFLETVEKRERERMARDEAWKAREISRMNREHELLARERSMAAAKDAAVISFLQKVSEHTDFSISIGNITPTAVSLPEDADTRHHTPGENASSSSRWPKTEVQALIKVRTNMDLKYHDGGAKGPLWEDVSSAMAKLGYTRSAKRCKEKWENINKYFKKVKETNKRRPEDSKTCPYFHELDAIYKQRAKTETPIP